MYKRQVVKKVCKLSLFSQLSAPIKSGVTGLLFFSRFPEISRKRKQPNAAGPIIMFHEVATLVHLIKSSKPEARAEGIRLMVLLEVP